VSGGPIAVSTDGLCAVQVSQKSLQLVSNLRNVCVLILLQRNSAKAIFLMDFRGKQRLSLIPSWPFVCSKSNIDCTSSIFKTKYTKI